MATRAKTVTITPTYMVCSWEGLLDDSGGDDGTPVKVLPYKNVTVQVLGNFGTGGAITMEGSNDGGTTWDTLHLKGVDDAAGAYVAATFNSTLNAGVILETPLLIRPDVSAGSGSVDLDVHITAVY